MAKQIPYDDPIWELTPTELNVAYLSLSLSKREIATQLVMSENTVGTHLTNIYDNFGLSGLLDEEKRAQLKEKYGPTIERMVAEVQGDYQVEYKKRRKEALARQAEVARRTQEAEVPPVRPRMNEAPPDPRTQPQSQPRGVNRQVPFLAILGLLGCLFVMGASWIIWQTINQQPPPIPSSTSTSGPQVPTTTPQPSPTSQPTTTPESSPTPEELLPEVSPTPQVSPTPLSLPIREDFSEKYGDLWLESGNPIVVESIPFGRYKGVLTTDEGQTAKLFIGNTAWTDYIVTLTMRMPRIDNHLLIGVRVKDPNNMIALDCTNGYICAWVVRSDGVWDRTPTEKWMVYDTFTITVQGDKFIAVASCMTCNPQSHEMSYILPPKYEGKFPGGGVLIEITSIMEVDYIEIHEFP